VDTQTVSWREDRICPYKEVRQLPSGRNKDAINTTKEPCLFFTVIPPILLEHIGEKVVFEEGIAVTP